MPKINQDKERIGEINKNKFDSIMIIEKYNNYSDIWVRFIDSDNLVNTRYNHFKSGAVLNPFDKSIYSIGYFGEGDYKSSLNGKSTRKYDTWYHMLQRCYSEKSISKHPSYIDCSVSHEWHNFQNFAKWYDENYYEIDDERVHLDKDILTKGNKIYSPENCIFVPLCINSLFTKAESIRGDLPIGVFWNSQSKKYHAHCMNKGKQIPLGKFDTSDKAFRSYKTYKEKLIKQIAEEYKEKIPTKLFDAMINYIVEIDD